MARSWKTYLLCFAQEHVEFRYSEISALLSLLNIDMKYVVKPQEIEPYWIVKFQSESDAKRLTNRSVLLRNSLELWAHGKSIEHFHEELKLVNFQEKSEFFEVDKTFKVEVETFCKHFSQKEKVDKIETLNYLPVKGAVDLKNPDVCFQYVEYYGTNANSPPEKPYDVFFGRWIANGLRQLIQKLSLKTRKFIGNTSMDPQLSLLMANQAKVTAGDVVFDPFVGSGSLLVAAAEFGGYVFGADIDYLMLHAKTRPSRITQTIRGKDESIAANMLQYNLQNRYLDVMINDFAKDFWADSTKFDSIITDPPYGIREATEKIGSTKTNCKISDKHLPTHIPAKVEYGISNIYKDLLIFSSKHLRLGGRTVCWFPVFREDYSEAGLPAHPCLKLVSNCEQILNKNTSRRLLTYEKVVEPNPEMNECLEPIDDFRTKYFVVREETRREKRMREAQVRETNRLEALKRNSLK